MIVFRHADPRFPFLWESADQPPARWHGHGEGPVHYFCDTLTVRGRNFFGTKKFLLEKKIAELNPW